MKHRVNKLAGYTNFNNREDTWHDVGEFSWDFHAVELFSKFLPDLADAIHSELIYAFHMTKFTYGSKAENIDTTYFR